MINYIEGLKDVKYQGGTLKEASTEIDQYFLTTEHQEDKSVKYN